MNSSEFCRDCPLRFDCSGRDVPLFTNPGVNRRLRTQGNPWTDESFVAVVQGAVWDASDRDCPQKVQLATQLQRVVDTAGLNGKGAATRELIKGLYAPPRKGYWETITAPKEVLAPAVKGVTEAIHATLEPKSHVPVAVFARASAPVRT